jgi:chromosome transmission fidelity protein 18
MEVETLAEHPAMLSMDGSLKSSNKRRKLDDERRSPLKEVDDNTRKHAFFESISDDEDEEPEFVHKATTTVENISPETLETATKAATLLPPANPDVEERHTEGSQSIFDSQPLSSLLVETFSGKSHFIGERRKTKLVPYEQIIASRSVTEEGRAKKSYYGIDVHELLGELANEQAVADAQSASHANPLSSPAASVEKTAHHTTNKRKSGLWCDRYRAHKFTDLVGDERTHRSVLHWLKRWDPIVFPGSRLKRKLGNHFNKGPEESTSHRKVLILAGPPGLGKTTLAHVCARQAGYEVHEINGSDERTARVVKERISDMLGTENVRGINTKTANGVVRKAGKPQCVVVDEVDGVVGGGRDEAGFIKALLELIQLDQKNSSGTSTAGPKRGKKKFRMLRPLILVCNDLYHPSLRGLRQSSLVEVIHMRKPPINAVISRVCTIFEREGVSADMDGIRRLCEAIWGVSTRKDGRGSSGTAVGDIRSVLVVGEWVASKFRQTTSSAGNSRLTKSWIEENMLNELAYGGGAARSLGRGSTKEIVERVFQEDAGFLKTDSSMNSKQMAQKTGAIGVAEAGKRRAMNRLNEMIYTSGETDRIVTGEYNKYLQLQRGSDIFRLLHVLSHTSNPR